MKAIRVEKIGGSEVLQYQDHDLPDPSEHQIRVRHAAIGVNFIDIYHRTGLYPLPLPTGLGSEAVGMVEEIGKSVTRFDVGDRVGYCSGAIGAYAEANNVPESRLERFPPDVNLFVGKGIELTR
jgi:NADPH2:quinone reductase